MNQEFVITRNNEQITLTDEELERANQFVLASKGRERLENLLCLLEDYDDYELEKFGVDITVEEFKTLVKNIINDNNNCFKFETNVLNDFEGQCDFEYINIVYDGLKNLMEGQRLTNKDLNKQALKKIKIEWNSTIFALLGSMGCSTDEIDHLKYTGDCYSELIDMIENNLLEDAKLEAIINNEGFLESLTEIYEDEVADYSYCGSSYYNDDACDNNYEDAVYACNVIKRYLENLSEDK